ncbi:MAG: DNRLRE domain-containing protein [Agriterribacter sp.]
MNCKPFAPMLAALAIMFSSCEKEDILNNKVPIAEAGESQTVQVPNQEIETTATLTGVGTDADGKVVAYIWSQVSGPNSADIVNEGSPSTTVNKLITGTYLFQLMVVDDGGATGVDTVSVIVKGPQSFTLTFQPHKNPNEVHIYGNSTYEGSGPGQTEIGAVSWTDGGRTIGMRGAFKFDLSSIPTTATITSAKLSLYSNPTPLNGHPDNENRANYGTNNAMLIQRITESWTASSVTWNNQPASSSTNQIVVPHTASPFLDLVDLDVTNLVKDMTGANANYGFLIKLQNEVTYNSRVFCSSFYSDNSKHPTLIVTYSN